MTGLAWLPNRPDWRVVVRQAEQDGAGAWETLLQLARSRLDFVGTNAIDAAIRYVKPRFEGTPVRLAILSSCTCNQLHAGIRVAGVRRELEVSIYEGEFGQYWQELADPGSGLHDFQPNTILFALDAQNLAAGVNAGMTQAEADLALEDIQARIRECWRLAKDRCGVVIQQVPLPVHLTLLGSNEHRLPGSKANFIKHLSAALRPLADSEGVDLLALDDRISRDGLSAWHDVGLWHRAKQEISPVAAPLYGDLVLRIIAARQGCGSKCLVLDLDNTLWGGVIGDDGLGGIVLGQGSALGEAFVAFQEYARELSRRGVILAVCSKNDEANALEPFENHPEMLLKRGDIACFVANWSDKVANIREIAAQLNIGLNSLVFIDDNPFERALVRQELPMVAVPEIGDDPVDFPRLIADAGYFEGVAVTEDDRARVGQYQENILREVLRTSTTDLPSYLRSLQMQLVWRRFDHVNLSRIVQLINKTNQFNLTTRRYTEIEVLAVIDDPASFGLQMRLTDRFGDNGIIAIVICRLETSRVFIDTWLMSCRVLGRQVEQDTLALIVAQARHLGASELIGEYIPTTKNGMVKDHYKRLGFIVGGTDETGRSWATLDLAAFEPATTFTEVKEG